MDCIVGNSTLERPSGSDGLPGDTRGHIETNITARGLLRLLTKQSYKCALTGRDVTPETASLDHMVPLSRGGANTLENSQIVHVEVNAAKATMTCDEFVAMCREVVAHCGE